MEVILKKRKSAESFILIDTLTIELRSFLPLFKFAFFLISEGI